MRDGHTRYEFRAKYRKMLFLVTGTFFLLLLMFVIAVIEIQTVKISTFYGQRIFNFKFCGFVLYETAKLNFKKVKLFYFRKQTVASANLMSLAVYCVIISFNVANKRLDTFMWP